MFRAILSIVIALIIGLFAIKKLSRPMELDEVSRKEIAERIAPSGIVCQKGTKCETAVDVDVIINTVRSGEEIFNSFCTACHTSGLLGAPKKNDSTTWQEKQRIAGTFNKLLENAITGFGNMPPKGTCMDCSHAEISSAIQFMSNLKP